MNILWAFAPIIPVAATWLAIECMTGTGSTLNKSSHDYSTLGAL